MEGPAKEYKCAANLCWMCMAADYDWPVNTTEIEHMMRFFFATPAHLAGDGVVVALSAGEIPGEKRNLTVISPWSPSMRYGKQFTATLAARLASPSPRFRSGGVSS